MLEDHVLKIRGQEVNDLKATIHRVDAVITVLCVGRQSESFWLSCPTCSKQFMQLFRVRLLREDLALEPVVATPPKLRLLDKLGENMRSARKLLHDGDLGTEEITDQAQKILDMVATMKRRARSASIS